MKLDYLQFLELEVFTRFGARLEASMEAAIKRGRMLRELLKQERLSPLPPTSQLSWLVAFNDGLLDSLELDAAKPLTAALDEATRQSDLTLTSPREEWAAAVAGWVKAWAEGDAT